VGGFVSNAVEKPASRHIYAANDRSLVTLTICRNGTDYEGFLSPSLSPASRPRSFAPVRKHLPLQPEGCGMIAAPRLIRTAGVFALAVAALFAAGGQASANLHFGIRSQSRYFRPDPDDHQGQRRPDRHEFGDDRQQRCNDSDGVSGLGDRDHPHRAGPDGDIDHDNRRQSRLHQRWRLLRDHRHQLQPIVNVTIAGSASCDGTYGSAFQYNDVTAVDIGGTQAPSFTVTLFSTTQITGTTPPGISGVTNVEVFTTNNNSGGSGNNIFAYIPGGPSVSGVGPQIGLTTVAQPVTISGNNFISGTFANGTPATTVTFNCNGVPNTQPLNAIVTSIGSIALTAPTCGTAGADQVTVMTPGGSSSGTYQYVAPGTPSVTSISPSTRHPSGRHPGHHFRLELHRRDLGDVRWHPDNRLSNQ